MNKPEPMAIKHTTICVECGKPIVVWALPLKGLHDFAFYCIACSRS